MPVFRRILSPSARLLIELLNRPIGRPLVTQIISRAIRLVHAEHATVRHFSDGYWVIDWPDQSVPMPLPWPSPPPAYYEERAKDVFLQEYTPSAGDVVVDVGAGVGTELNLFSRLVGPSGRVFAIEADPDTFKWLLRRQELNDLSNVTLVQGAIVDRPGEVLISSEGFHETHRLVPGGAGHRVRALTLDDLIAEQGITRIDFLKMNIEGAERLALAGMERSAGCIRNLAVSCHDFLADHGGDDSMRTHAFVENVLRRHGFALTPRRTDDDRDWARSYVYARHTEKAIVAEPE